MAGGSVVFAVVGGVGDSFLYPGGKKAALRSSSNFKFGIIGVFNGKLEKFGGDILKLEYYMILG